MSTNTPTTPSLPTAAPEAVGRGSAGNVLAALCSLAIPGLGQLVQGRMGKSLWHVLVWLPFLIIGLITGGFLYFFAFPWHIWSCYEASKWRP
jgi:hypothetical protein